MLQPPVSCCPAFAQSVKKFMIIHVYYIGAVVCVAVNNLAASKIHSQVSIFAMSPAVTYKVARC